MRWPRLFARRVSGGAGGGADVGCGAVVAEVLDYGRAGGVAAQGTSVKRPLLKGLFFQKKGLFFFKKKASFFNRWRRCARHKCVTSVKRGLCLWQKRSICGAKETCYYRRDLLLVRWHAGGMRKRQKRPAHMAKETGLRRKRDLLLHCHTGIPEDVAHGAHTVQRPIYSKDDREVRDVLVQA